jgi:hypothetical protein
MSGLPVKRLFPALLFLILSAALRADDLLAIEIWCEVQPMAFSPDADNTGHETDAYQELLEEARLIFSGMIYGYTFTYIPLDKAHGVNELLEIKPVAEIAWGDKNLKFVSGDFADNRLYGRFTYTLAGFQNARRESWQTLGEGKQYLGADGKKLSREQAVKAAGRNFLRPRLFNKPREIRGEIVFLESPQMNIDAGAYVSLVKVKINIREIIPYSIH